MSSTFIATTSRASYNAMRHQGILVTDSYAQLRAMLEKNLSPQHALLFAEPMHDSSGASTDWYTTAEGAPVPLSSLSPEQKAKAGGTLASLAGDIDRLAAELMQSPEAPKNIRGNILSLALHYPDASHLYMVGDQPVMTCWGFDPGTLGAQPEDLVRLGAAMAAAPVPPPPPGPAGATVIPAATAASAGFGWLRALLFFLLGLLLLVGLFLLAGLLFGPAGCVTPNALPSGCAALAPPVGNATRAQDSSSTNVDSNLVSSLTAEREKELSLRRQLDELRKELQKRAAECPRTPTPVEPPKRAELPKIPEPPKVEPPKEELPKEELPKKEEPLTVDLPEQPSKKEPEKLTPDPPAQEPPTAEETEPPSLAELMPHTPAVPEKPLAPPVTPKQGKQPQEKQPQEKPKPEPKPQKQAKGEEMRIPDDARKNNDLSFLEGCWNSETGLRSDRTKEPIGVQYCFDAKGRGSRTITKPESGDRCVGSVRAQFDSSGKLRIDSDGAPCNKGGGFVPELVDCTSAAGKAECYGNERGGQQRKWKARFRRS